MKQNEDQVVRQFSTIKSRQLIATLLALSAVVVIAVVSKRPDLFGGALSRSAAMKAQLFIILFFINFTAFNWKCPSCRKYLGSDIKKPTCRKCGVRLQ